MIYFVCLRSQKNYCKAKFELAAEGVPAPGVFSFAVNTVFELVEDKGTAGLLFSLLLRRDTHPWFFLGEWLTVKNLKTGEEGFVPNDYFEKNVPAPVEAKAPAPKPKPPMPKPPAKPVKAAKPQAVARTYTTPLLVLPWHCSLPFPSFCLRI